LFVKKSKQDGYRSRAAYKLLEIQKKHPLLFPGMTIIDLGAAPGSWSQVVIELLTGTNTIKNKQKLSKVIAVDILPIEPIKNVDIILGDITKQSVVEAILKLIGNNLDNNSDNRLGDKKGDFRFNGNKVDLVLSDMAPNLSGIWEVDMPRCIYLYESAMSLVKILLKNGGDFLIKAFNGVGFDKYLIMLRKNFSKVIICKPKSSRAESREIYVLAKGYKLI
jgi:23S rRNA (uridine2552-2'-O)-methyltransferase